MHLFTYGTLMFPQVWQMVVGRSFATTAAAVAGYAVQGIKGAVYPGMVQSDARSTAVGLVYLNIDEAALVRLDRFEDDFYARELVTATCSDGQIRDAFAYVVPAAARHVLTGQPWTAEDFEERGDLARFMTRYSGWDQLDSLTTDEA